MSICDLPTSEAKQSKTQPNPTLSFGLAPRDLFRARQNQRRRRRPAHLPVSGHQRIHRSILLDVSYRQRELLNRAQHEDAAAGKYDCPGAGFGRGGGRGCGASASSPSRSAAKMCHAHATATRRQNALVLRRGVCRVKLAERPCVRSSTCEIWWIRCSWRRQICTDCIISFPAVPAVPNRVLSPSTRSNGNVSFRTIRKSTTAERQGFF